MPTQVSYPGVYIEEIPSGVRTISGVATSIACFIGWAPMGPTDRAVRIGSFSDYVRTYGLIHPNSYLGYAVKQFFSNGGSDAYILRVTKGDASQNEIGECEAGGIKFKASSPGDWSRGYGVKITKRVLPGSTEKKFRLEVVEFARTDDGSIDSSRYSVVETFNNVSLSGEQSSLRNGSDQ
ncbi:MAG: hypothetical protein U0930_23335 [Pirellulales bacterium]